MPREAGVLLHLSSLPSSCGIGDLGPGAYRFVEFLARSGMTLWQILPFCPTEEGRGNSPYSASSAFAGNPLFISLDFLVGMGLLETCDILPPVPFREDRVEYGKVTAWKNAVLGKAFEAALRSSQLMGEVAGFHKAQRHWLEDYALFSVLKKAYSGQPWTSWPESLRKRDPAVLAKARKELWRSVEEEIFRQYLFFRQWGALKSFCRGKGIELLGDLPIYVDHDSADVWAHQNLFDLDGEGHPNSVAGVPPDYFSETGQRWGNPLFRWGEKREELFSWWEARVAHLLCCCDRIRFDHFRGFFAFWSIPGTEPTAVRGTWRAGPGESLFLALRERFGRLPFVAEDLGVIPEDVRRGMERLGLPGMRVLLFAFAGFDAENPYLPHNHDRKTVVYSGTHDNNTSLGWFDREATPEEREALSDYLGFPLGREAVAAVFLRMALSSVAETAILPMQDILGLGREARMNRPGTVSRNWEWRVQGEHLSLPVSERLRRFLQLYGRARR